MARPLISVSISNASLDKLVKDIQDNYSGPAREAAQRVCDKYADLMYEAVLANVPIDTGNLKASITKVVEDLRFVIFTNVTYAGYVEFGTRYMRARPFMQDAFLQYAQPFYDELKAALLNPTS